MSAVLMGGTVRLVAGFGLTRLTPSSRPKTLTSIISAPRSPLDEHGLLNLITCRSAATAPGAEP